MPKITPFATGEHLTATKLNRVRQIALDARDMLCVSEQPQAYNVRLRDATTPGVVFVVVGGVPAASPAYTELADAGAWWPSGALAHLRFIAVRADGGATFFGNAILGRDAAPTNVSFAVEPPYRIWIFFPAASSFLVIRKDSAMTNDWRVMLHVSLFTT